MHPQTLRTMSVKALSSPNGAAATRGSTPKGTWKSSRWSCGLRELPEWRLAGVEVGPLHAREDGADAARDGRDHPAAPEDLAREIRRREEMKKCTGAVRRIRIVSDEGLEISKAKCRMQNAKCKMENEGINNMDVGHTTICNLHFDFSF